MMKNLPKHIAVIPDGNRRWAKKRGLSPWEGHREGAKRFEDISSAAFEFGIPYFTFWAASEDNLTKRSKVEVRFLLSILREQLEREFAVERFVKEKVRVRVIGRWREIIQDKKLTQSIENLEEQTKKFSKKNLTILLGYDGRREMIEAIKKLKMKNEKVKIVAEDMPKALWTGELPEVDFVIRTGGEPHWSAGFMMWLTSDSQLYFTDTLWPDFNEKEFQKALADFTSRERRFGA